MSTRAPKVPKVGPPWLKDFFRDLITFIEEQKPIGGIGTLVSETKKGRRIDAGIGGAGGGSSLTYPWDLTISGTDLSILPGSINNFIPSNMFTTITISVSGTLFVKLACTTDGNVITAVSIVVDGTPAASQTPTNGALPSTFEYPVGVIVDGVGYNTSRKLLTAVGSRLFLADKASPAGPGELAFEEWLVWSIS